MKTITLIVIALFVIAITVFGIVFFKQINKEVNIPDEFEAESEINQQQITSNDETSKNTGSETTDSQTSSSSQSADNDNINIEIYLDGDKENGIYIGNAEYGVTSNEAASIYGNDYLNSGFYLQWNKGDYVFEPGSIHYIFFYAKLPGEDEILIRKEIKLQGIPQAKENIRIYLETPSESIVEKEILISGWATDTNSSSGTNINRMEIYLDGPRGFGKFLGNAEYGFERGDVAESFGNSNYTNSGFRGTFDISGLEQGSKHSIYIYAITNSDEYNLYKKNITVKGQAGAKTDANIFINSSLENDFSNESVEISGWIVNMDYKVKRIVFASNKNGNDDIFSSNLDGSDLKQLTDSPGSDLYPCVSADGEKIVYSSDVKGMWQIMIMNWDGTDKKQLTFNNERNGDPAWSYDGKQIYFERFTEGDWELYKMNSDGSDEQRLTINPFAHDWHPFGYYNENKIIYESGQVGSYDLFIMNDDGTNIKKMLDIAFEKRVPSMSKNGGYIIFQGRAKENKFFNIYIMEPDGENLKRLTEDSTEHGHAIISPDNQFIVFEVLFGTRKQIFIMNLDGSEKRQVIAGEDYSAIMPDFIYIKY
ncbi:MAG: DUF5050 domain-containing protein [Actinomycetota bacterium]